MHGAMFWRVHVFVCVSSRHISGVWLLITVAYMSFTVGEFFRIGLELTYPMQYL